MSYELCSAVQSLNISPEQFIEIVKNIQPDNWSTILTAIISSYFGLGLSLFMYSKQKKDKERDEKRKKEEDSVAKVNLLLSNLLQSIDDQILNTENLEKCCINNKNYAIREVADYNCIYECISIFSRELPEILYELNTLKTVIGWIKIYGKRFYGWKIEKQSEDSINEAKDLYLKEINKALTIIIPAILVIHDYAQIKFKKYNILSVTKKSLKHKTVKHTPIIKRLNNKEFFQKKYQYSLKDEKVLNYIIGKKNDK